MAYQTGTLTGTYFSDLGHESAAGTVEIFPVADNDGKRIAQILDGDGKAVLTGRVKVDLDGDGKFTVTLPATDDASLNPTGFGYVAVARLAHVHLPAVTFQLPGGTTVDVGDVTDATPASFTARPTYVDQAALDAVQDEVDGLAGEVVGKADQATVDGLAGEVAGKANTADLAPVATSGDYDDLDGKPTIPGIDIRTVGAVADKRTAVCSISSDSDVLTRSSGAWGPDDVGKVLSVPGAQATADALGRTNMPATIEAFIDATQVQLDRTATATATDVQVEYATDNRAVLQAAFNAAKAGLIESVFIIPGPGARAPGDGFDGFVTNQVMPSSNTTIMGPGELIQAPRNWNDPGNSTRNGGLLMPWHDERDSAEPVEPCVNTHIRYVRINGNKGLHYGSIANRTNGEGINFKWARQCSAEFNVIWDVDGDGIDFDYSEDCLAVGNHITNASGWGIHHSNGNRNNKVIGNTAVLCGWDQYTDSGIICGGFDCSQESSDITYIGNTADGCMINYGLGGTGFDPAVYRLIAFGNRSLSVAATPAHPDSFAGVISGDMVPPTPPTSFPAAVTFAGVSTFNAAVVVNEAPILTRRASANGTAVDAGQVGDSVARYSVRASGAMNWSSGSATADVSLFRSAANELMLAAGDVLRLDGSWSGPLRLGNHRIWVDATGVLRIKNGAPTSDIDGTPVGAQS